MTPQAPRHAARRRRGPLAAWLVVALLFAQWLGLAHRIVHAPVLPGAAALHAVTPLATPAAMPGHADHEADAWSHDAGTAECRLLDQLCSADGLPTFELAPLIDAPVQLAGVAIGRTSLPRRAFARALARAPPVTG